MNTTAGSTLWLLAHELRLARRGFLGLWSRKSGWRGLMLRAGVIGIVLHLAAVPIALALTLFPLRATPTGLVIATAGLLVVWSLMLSQSLFGVTQALYMRGDLDLLLSSPLAPQKILVARALAIVMNAIGAWMLLAVPFVDVLVLFGQFHWLSLFPILFSLGLLATAVGLALAMALLRLIGPARTRTTAQVLAVLIGATAFLCSQARAFLPDDARNALWHWQGSLADADRLGPASPLWWPARALLGDGQPLLVICLASVLTFGLAIAAFASAFAANARAIAGLTIRVPRPARNEHRPMPPFTGGQRAALLRKEWRLLVRDPWLISQILMQILYLLPLCFLYWRQTRGDNASLGGIAMMAVVVAGHLAGGLVWITIASEDSPDLLSAAPIGLGEILAAKLVAALTPVLCLLALPLAAIASAATSAGAFAFVGCAAAAASATLLGLWYQRPGRRRDFMRRRKGSAIVNLAELVLNFCWGLATAMAVARSPWAVLFAGIALAVMFGLRLIAKPTPLLAGA